MFDTAQIFFVDGSCVRQYISSTPKEMFLFSIYTSKVYLKIRKNSQSNTISKTPGEEQP